MNCGLEDYRYTYAGGSPRNGEGVKKDAHKIRDCMSSWGEAGEQKESLLLLTNRVPLVKKIRF